MESFIISFKLVHHIIIVYYKGTICCFNIILSKKIENPNRATHTLSHPTHAWLHTTLTIINRYVVTRLINMVYVYVYVYTSYVVCDLNGHVIMLMWMIRLMNIVYVVMHMKNYGCLYSNVYFVIIVCMFSELFVEPEVELELEPSLK